jgi:hypothetical protein
LGFRVLARTPGAAVLLAIRSPTGVRAFAARPYAAVGCAAAGRARLETATSAAGSPRPRPRRFFGAGATG